MWVSGIARLTNRVALEHRLARKVAPNDLSDLQLIAHGFEVFGQDWFVQLRGVFSVVLLLRKGEVICVRDQMGLIPLYYFYKREAIFVDQ